MRTLFTGVTLVVLTMVKGWAQPWVIPTPDSPPWCPEGTGCNAQISATLQGVDVHGVAHCRLGFDGVFDRPVLLLEGIDFNPSTVTSPDLGFGDLHWGTMFGSDLTQVPLAVGYRPMLDSLHAKGADVVMLDFEDGTTSLERKTALARRLLELVLSSKVGNTPVTLVGVSMGGVVARMALAQWEAEAGPGHCVSPFVAIDAPFLGAILPQGVQGLMSILAGQSDQAAQFWEVFNSPAAKQLLRNHIQDSFPHQNAVAMLNNLGWPEQTKQLNVVNSHNQGVAPLSEDPLLHVEWALSPWSQPSFMMRAERWNSENAFLAAAILPGDLNPSTSLGILDADVALGTWTETDWESVAGSSGDHLAVLASSLAQEVDLTVTHWQLQEEVTFVPHESALGGPNSPWDAVSTAPMTNPREDHASLPPHHRAWLMDQLDATWTQSVPLFNEPYGSETVLLNAEATSPRLIHSTVLAEGDTMWIGDVSAPCEATTSPCAGEIVVGAHAVIHVGSEVSSGVLNISAGTALTVEPGGTVHIHPGSKLVIQPGGDLTVGGGRLVLEGDALLRIEHDGRLELQEGAEWLVEDEAGLVDVYGTVHVAAHVEAQWETNGHVDWQGGSRLWLGSQSALHCDGNNTGSWTLAGPVAWHGPGHAHLESLKAFWLSEGHLHATCRTTIEDCDLNAEGPTDPSLFSEGRTRISHSKVGGLLWEHQGQGSLPTSNSAFFAQDSQWDDCDLTLSECSAHISDNDFFHSPIRIEAPQTPFKVTGNTLQAPWHATTPTLSLHHGEGNSAWLEDNVWIQGLGLHLNHTSAALKCNTWLECGAGAIHIEGVAPACMASVCGGGGNVFDQNAWHIVLSDGPLPQMSGANHLGWALDGFIQGTTSDQLTSWTVAGCSWDPAWGMGLWTGEVSSELSGQPEAGGLGAEIPVFAFDPRPRSPCSSVPSQAKPLKKTESSGLWNLLGQELQEGQVSSNASKADK